MTSAICEEVALELGSDSCLALCSPDVQRGPFFLLPPDVTMGILAVPLRHHATAECCHRKNFPVQNSFQNTEKDPSFKFRILPACSVTEGLSFLLCKRIFTITSRKKGKPRKASSCLDSIVDDAD